MPDNRNNGSTRNGSNGTRNYSTRNSSGNYSERNSQDTRTGRSSVRSASGRTTARSASATGTRSTGEGRNQTYDRSAAGSRSSVNGRSAAGGRTMEGSRSRQNGQNPRASQNRRPSEQVSRANTSQKRTGKSNKKKKNKIALFVIEFCVLAVLLLAFWFVNQGTKVDYVAIDEENIVINDQVQELSETGAMKGYRNIALFGVDSRNGELDKNTRTDTIMIASINQDTKEVKLVSVFRDTYLNLGTDTYNKANSAYAKGGPEQAINMLNMNLDLNITDFVTIGFEGLIDVIDAVGGVEIDVKESEIDHLNNYQISMVGKENGKNAAGETSYVATAGKDYTPVTSPGLQTLNGLQATAYCRIRYVGNDFERAKRQRTVLAKVAEKAKTLDVSKLSKIAEAVFGETATSLELDEIVSLLSEASQYKIGDSEGFPFEENRATGTVGKKGSCVVPVDLTDNVIQLHQFLFNESDYTPSATVKECSEKIYSDTSKYVN